MNHPYKLRQLSINNLASSTPKYIGSKTPLSQQKFKSVSSYNLTMYEPWAKPLVLNLNIDVNKQKNKDKKQNFVKGRKLVSTLKYKKILGDNFRKESSFNLGDKGEDKLMSTIHSRTAVRFNIKNSSNNTISDNIETMKRTLKQSCQSKAITLQNRPYSSRRIRTQTNEIIENSMKRKQLLYRMKDQQMSRRKRSQTFDCLCGW